MTKHEQIRMHLRTISRITQLGGEGWCLDNLVASLQEELSALKKLLEPEPESRSLVDLNNELGRENALLRNDLTEMTLNYNGAEKHVKQLSRAFEKDLRCLKDELYAAIRSNAWLRERFNFKDDALRSARSVERSRRISYLEQARSADKCYIQRLKEEAKERIEVLEKDLATLTRQNWRHHS